MKRLILILCLLFASPAVAGITVQHTTGATIYAHVKTGASSYVHCQLTEDSSTGWYTATDAALVSAGLNTAHSGTIFAASGFPFVITTNATSSASPLFTGSIAWSGSVELPTTANLAQISEDATAADNLETMLDGTGGSTLSLGSVSVVNSSGNAVLLQSTGGNGTGLYIVGDGTGEGIRAVGGATGHGFQLDRGDATRDDIYLSNSDAPTVASVVWDALKASYTTPDSFGDYLDDEVSGAGGSEITAEEIADEVFSMDISTATGAADSASFSYKLLNAPTPEELAEEIGPIVAEEVGNQAAVSAFLVDEDHTWAFQSRSQTTSPQLITELRGTGGFNGLVAMDFTIPMPAGASIASIGTVSVADEAGKTEPTLSSAQTSADRKKVHVPVNATSATAGTYTISVTITTTDSQTFMRKGRLVLQ